MASITKKTSEIKFYRADQFVVRKDRNVRLEWNYDTASMVEQIVAKGRIEEALTLEEMADGTLETRRGNRRGTAAQQIFLNPSDYPPEVVEAMNAIPCVVYARIANADGTFSDGLTEAERFSVVLDHGSQKPINSLELVRVVWKMYAMDKTTAEIGTDLLQPLARFTGNEKKINDLPTGPSRVKEIGRWFKGTLEQWLRDAAMMGSYVKEQFELTMLKLDGLLTDEQKETWEVDCNRVAIKLLREAKNEDRKNDQWDDMSSTGPNFNRVLEELKDKKAGRLPGSEKRPLSATKLEQRLDSSHSVALKTAFKAAAGESVDWVKVDEEVSRLEKIQKVLLDVAPQIKDPALNALIGAVLHSPAESKIADEQSVKKVLTDVNNALNRTAEETEKRLTEKDLEIARLTEAKEGLLTEKDAEILRLTEELKIKEGLLTEKEGLLTEKDVEIARLTEELTAKHNRRQKSS